MPRKRATPASRLKPANTAKIVLPDDFVKCYQAGILHPAKGIRLSDFSWMTSKQIQSFVGPSYLSDRLVPFALSPAGDRFGWWKADGGTGYEYVVLSWNDCNEADVYARDFTAFLYRKLLDECRECWFCSQDGSSVEAATAIMGRNVDLAEPHLPKTWTRALRKILSRQPDFSEEAGTVTWAKKPALDKVVLRDLGFDGINSHVQQYF
jgi:hypothetical protein